MILYLAESSMRPEQWNRLADEAGADNFLFAFDLGKANESARHFCSQPYRRIFVDSGAYSAWSNPDNRRPISLDNYISFCKEIMGKAKGPVVFAALDVIPGRKGGPDPTQDERERACEEGWKNYERMNQAGISPCLMTYHQGEPLKQLERIADGSRYFAVAPRKDATTKEKHRFLKNDVFAHVGRLVYAKKLQIHGFGVASITWMKEFPFYSVDSTAWEECRRHYRHRFYYAVCGRGRGAFVQGKTESRIATIHSMKFEVMLGRQITELWRKKGVVWDDQPPEHGHPDVPCRDHRCPICSERGVRAAQVWAEGE